jgi:hypothetical protein
LRGFCDDETWIDRGATSSTAVQGSTPRVIYGGAARRSYGPRATGTPFGTLRTSVARSRSLGGPTPANKTADLQALPAMARPGLEPGTTRFSVLREEVSNRPKSLRRRWSRTRETHSGDIRCLRTFRPRSGTRRGASTQCESDRCSSGSGSRKRQRFRARTTGGPAEARGRHARRGPPRCPRCVATPREAKAGLPTRVRLSRSYDELLALCRRVAPDTSWPAPR